MLEFSLFDFSFDFCKLDFLLLLCELFASLLPILFDFIWSVAFSCCVSLGSTARFRLLLGLLVTALLLFVFAFALLPLKHLSEDGLLHHLIYFLFEGTRLSWSNHCAHFPTRCCCLDNQAEFLRGLFAVLYTVFLALLAL